MSEILYVSKETLELMKAELQHLKTVERPAASKAIAEAREKGDLRENAEYDAAKESILTRVKITNIATNKSVVYQIVSEKEADLKLLKISVTSPIGKGLLGKKVGDVAEITAPNGVMKFKIEEISL
jgi:transcription elongation factor GreA